jgi:hypothetical protein
MKPCLIRIFWGGAGHLMLLSLVDSKGLQVLAKYFTNQQVLGLTTQRAELTSRLYFQRK